MKDEFSWREFLQTTVEDSVHRYFEQIKKHPLKFLAGAALIYAVSDYITQENTVEIQNPAQAEYHSLYR